MDFIIGHKVVQENGHDVIVLYLNPQLEEISDELGKLEAEKNTKFEHKIKAYIKKHVSLQKAGAIKIMAGSILISSILFSPIHEKAEAADFNMSYLFFGSTAQQITFVDRSKDAVDTVSPSYFDLNADGTLKISGQFSTTFINDMKSKNKRVVPFLSNHWDREVGRAALANREQLAQQVADTIIKYNLDGVNVDIENVTDVDRDAFTDLVRLLREKLPAGKEVSVAVAANPNGWTKGWHGSYDYNKLAQYSDYLMIMAYDESYQGGPSGPVASYGWVEKSVQYALKQGVPSDKIVLGIPFFGRYWNDAEATGGLGISSGDVEGLVRKYNGNITFDQVTKSVKATFTIKSTDPTSTVYGRTLKPGNYTVWYENADSIKAKIDLVHKYNLKGTGSWALGQENPEIWNSYRLWLEGYPFNDIVNHWARDEIVSVNKKGWMIGVTAEKFAPNETLTRAQAATIISRSLKLTAIEGETVTFKDFSQGHWAYQNIQLVAQHNLMQGLTKDRFAPDEPLTREQFAVILDRVLLQKGVVSTEDGKSPTSFNDVKGRWSEESIVRMSSLGIIKGETSTTFKPTDLITRGQMAAMMNRAAAYLES